LIAQHLIDRTITTQSNELPRCKHTRYGDLKRLCLRSKLRGNLFDYTHLTKQYQPKASHTKDWSHNLNQYNDITISLFYTMAAIILENLRSAYNVWNIVRTADALWRDVIIAWYTPSPLSHTKVQKTSLGAEQMIRIYEFPGRHFDGSDIIASHDAVNFARQHYW